MEQLTRRHLIAVGVLAGLLLATYLTSRSTGRPHVSFFVHRNKNRSSFYLDPSDNLFLALGKAVNTTKVSTHAYEVIYGKYFEPDNVRYNVRKILGIGLGCKTDYGPGHSVALWKRYYPNAEIWMADYDAACVEKFRHNLTGLGIKTVTGDQADFGTLLSWVATSGGGFDVIIAAHQRADVGFLYCALSAFPQPRWVIHHGGHAAFAESQRAAQDYGSCQGLDGGSCAGPGR